MLTVDRVCLQCGKELPKQKQSTAKFCGAGHRNKYHNAIARAKNLAKAAEENGAVLQSRRRGSTYERGLALDYWTQVLNGTMTVTAVADLLGVTVASASRSMATFRVELQKELDAEVWSMDERFAALLPTAEIEQLRSMEPDDESPLQESLLAIVEGAFWSFEHEFVTIGSRQQRFLVKPFHREIITEMVKAFVWGSRVLILTPPRHGKSELMIRFVAWIIIMYPNIQVIWVASNIDLAGGMTGKLKGIFEHSKALREAFLPPGKRFGDKGCTRWTENAFTLYTRTDHTLTSPTFIGLGSTSTIAGRNADFIGIDDLEERKTVNTADLRLKSRQKHAEIMERQEDHTGVVTIASRQHPDDIPNHLMDESGDDAWKVLVYPAHDEINCEEDPDEYKAHVECMLMPEIRPYKWLMKMQTETEALGLPGRYPLRYLQKSVPVEGIIFDIPLIKEVCLDKSRGIGMDELPPLSLLAGLDPAPRGTQASFLWGWDGETLHMIDLETAEAGGVIGAISVMERWYEKYQLDTWIHEDNSGQIDAWDHVPEFKALKQYINIKSHTTGHNKQDPESGISAMAPWYHSGRISLPYGTAEARRKTNLLLRQLELWTSDGLARKGKTDIKMAHWFPFPRIMRWAKRDRKAKLRLTSQQSFPSIGRNMNSAPWHTSYPGG